MAKTSTAAAPEPVLLVIADISGYTRYMAANAKTLAHSQTVITELVKAIIQTVELPLEIAKLEGDAVFLFCRKGSDPGRWAASKRIVAQKLLAFFQLFREKLAELRLSTTCTCQACTHIDRLRLKVIAHSGEALFHHVLNFLELAGVDVIILHRLLKNSVQADQYLLLTDAARADLDFAEELPLSASTETYDEIGRIKTYVYLPGEPSPSGHIQPSARLGNRIARSSQMSWRLWFAPFAAQRRFTHVATDVSQPARLAFALLTLVLTPIYLPVGLLFAVIQALKSSRAAPRHGYGHKHKADGSCCHP
ncbi:MAG: DUF2652 domain-containing protein [Verrucomicrobiota bacterium]